MQSAPAYHESIGGGLVGVGVLNFAIVAAVGGSHTEIKSRIEAAFAAIDRRDWDGFLDRVDPEIEYTPVEEAVTYRGRIEMRSYFERWFEVWEEAGLVVEEVNVSAGADRAMVAFRFWGKGQMSQAPTEGSLIQVADLRNGRWYRVREFDDRGEAERFFRTGS